MNHYELLRENYQREQNSQAIEARFIDADLTKEELILIFNFVNDTNLTISIIENNFYIFKDTQNLLWLDLDKVLKLAFGLQNVVVGSD